ncbi:unnamed protein product [Closterium sp. NIES-64]|nr:unnamed protein product [Closterium sp. NIES-64]
MCKEPRTCVLPPSPPPGFSLFPSAILCFIASPLPSPFPPPSQPSLPHSQLLSLPHTLHLPPIAPRTRSESQQPMGHHAAVVSLLSQLRRLHGGGNVRHGGGNVRHGGGNVRHGGGNVRHGGGNVRHGGGNVRHGGGNVRHSGGNYGSSDMVTCRGLLRGSICGILDPIAMRTLSQGLRKLQQLQHLDLSRNQLNGTLPEGLDRSTLLSHMSVPGHPPIIPTHLSHHSQYTQPNTPTTHIAHRLCPQLQELW